MTQIGRKLPLERQKSFVPRARLKTITLQRRVFSDEEIQEAKSAAKNQFNGKYSTQVKAMAVCILDTRANQEKPLDVEVQVIAFSQDFALVSLPGEIFVELGVAWKIASPFTHTFIAELANGSIGYIPNRSAYAEGLYEVVSTRCLEGSGELLVEEALLMLREVSANP